MIGDMSPDQARYGAIVAAGTGLDPVVVRSWIGSESGWGVTKATHNYLNVGPGMNFASVDQAAAKVVQLVNTSRHYGGIRAAIPAGPLAQVRAIQDSPWDAGHYAGGRLEKVYRQLAAAGGGATPASWQEDVTDALRRTVPGPWQLPDALNPFGGGIVDRALQPVTDAVLAAGLGLVFSAAALALIGLGLYKLTGAAAGDAVSAAQEVVGKVGQARTLVGAAAL